MSEEQTINLFANEISKLRYYREQLQQNNDVYYKEAELCYQLISLLLASDKMLQGKTEAADYLEEKCTTVFRCVRGLLEGKIET